MFILQAWEESDQVNAILLKGVGRALCAGGDVKGTYALEQYVKACLLEN